MRTGPGSRLSLRVREGGPCARALSADGDLKPYGFIAISGHGGRGSPMIRRGECDADGRGAGTSSSTLSRLDSNVSAGAHHDTSKA
eukprot:1009207-Prymnesium_polylepis.1